MNEDKALSVAAGLSRYLSTPLDDVLDRHLRESPEEAAVQRFHAVAANVPAYRAFLEERAIDPAGVRSIEDFRALPVITKENYVLRHPLARLCRGGDLTSCDMVAVSSGSTGKPTFWPRFVTDEYVIATRFEQVLIDSFRADVRSTLAVVCFALGTWVGGMFTASCCRHVASKGHPITVVTPGNNKDEILRIVEELGRGFDQVVLLGYPPFLKDVVDTGRARGVDWAPLRIKLVMAGEVFSEEWRSLVGERLGSAMPCHDSASLYGTADAGVLGNETPLSVAIRRFFAQNPAPARAIFGEARLPTLVQYDPMTRFFEVENGKLLFSGDNGVPLIRYGILDTGGVLSFDAMMDAVRGFGFDPPAALEREREGAARAIRRLPFVWVFGRSDFTVSYFGANIYPENVTVGLEQPGVKEWVTGKFVLQTVEDEDRNQHLSVVVELSPGEAASEAREALAARSIQEHLERLNSEFKTYAPADRRAPRVRLAPAGDPAYFPVGVKHRYTRR